MLIMGVEQVEYLKPILRKIVQTINYAKKNIPFYRGYNNIRSPEEYFNLPIIGPNHLSRDPYSFRPLNKNYFRVSTSGGTSNQLKLLFRTYQDHITSSQVAADMFKISGIKAKDKVAILQPFDLWGIGFIALEALRYIKSTGFPIGSNLSDAQCWDVLCKYSPDAIYCTPSRAISLIEYANSKVIENIKWTPRKILLAGEPISNYHRKIIANHFKSEVHSIYGSEEMDGIASECSAHKGMHLTNSGIIYELVNPRTMLPTSCNRGLLIVTNLNWRGTLLVRYNTGDIVDIVNNKCECGHISERITKIRRSDSGYYLWDATFLKQQDVEYAIDKIFGIKLKFQCVIYGASPPQYIEIDVERYENKNKISILIRKEFISCLINKNIDIKKSYMAKEIDINLVNKPYTSFLKNARGKIPLFIFMERKPRENS